MAVTSRQAGSRSHRAGIPSRGAGARSCSTSRATAGAGSSCSSTRATSRSICPTELSAFAKRHDEFLARGRGPARGEHEQLLQPQGLVRDRSAARRGPLSRDRRQPPRAERLVRRAGRGRDGGSRHVHHRPERRAVAHERHRARRRPKRRRGAAGPARVQDRCDVPRGLGARRSDADERRRLARQGVPGPRRARSSTSLGEHAETVSFAAGDTIVAEGDLADRFYVIARGRGRDQPAQPGGRGDQARASSAAGSSSARSGSSPRRAGRRPSARSARSS